ncbi:Ppx/GppA family phosphatase [Natronosporangium hydrolyticum]|uniref:Ppx/GppA family phosphatase n=1 Tax=Natronosporangium hydrolyticum TaxID=2811111 RepID=A0A895YNH2_9ACTN|nr:Ppx/GppA phosphatase family protein [Natronosporangium hydrolyticum]QSB17495.1 Ppx/GppA family phosphatase [Natronosporangium hydrolyticum]
MAAIDCGTNSVRLLVADLPSAAEQPLQTLTRRNEVVRLGEGVDRTGRLSVEALQRTQVALSNFAVEIRRWGASRVRMVATSATRDAGNSEAFVAMVVETLGVVPEVVTGAEEAQLSYLGAVRGLPVQVSPPYLVVDIGGGSTEFVVGESPEVHQRAVSVDIGCVRMTERYLRGDPPTPAEVEAAEADITAVVDQALAVVGRGGHSSLIGLAGSVTTVTGLALGLPEYLPERIHQARVSYDEVAKVTGELLTMGREQRLRLPVMHPGRADVIGAGALILRTVMARAEVHSVVASEHDILDGIAWSLGEPTP